MGARTNISFLLILALIAFSSRIFAQEKLADLGKFSKTDIDQILKHSEKGKNTGEKIQIISESLIGIPYLANSLIGAENIPEVFVIRLNGVDCFTLLDYIEALRRSSSFDEFIENLRETRYQNGIVEYTRRNHFFSDWIDSNGRYIKDVTRAIGGQKTRVVQKNLNQKKSGEYFLSGIQSKQELIKFIPSNEIDNKLVELIQNGDYIGIYSPIDGLDVSHVGIFVRKGKHSFIRHASSRRDKKQVLDEDFTAYIQNKPGIMIFRAK